VDDFSLVEKHLDGFLAALELEDTGFFAAGSE
jgi:hypothetical protein